MAELAQNSSWGSLERQVRRLTGRRRRRRKLASAHRWWVAARAHSGGALRQGAAAWRGAHRQCVMAWRRSAALARYDGATSPTNSSSIKAASRRRLGRCRAARGRTDGAPLAGAAGRLQACSSTRQRRGGRLRHCGGRTAEGAAPPRIGGCEWGWGCGELGIWPLGTSFSWTWAGSLG